MDVPFILCEKSYKMGIEEWLHVNYGVSPHVLWSGRTGSGKSVGAKVLLARSIILAPPELHPVELTIIDPKSDNDFSFLSGLSNFFRGEEAPKGLDVAFEAFRQRQNCEDITRNLKIVFIDEFASLINLIEDKKGKENAHRKLSLLLMLSRSFRFSIQTATQQPSAQTLGNSGNREQYGAVVLLGDAGAETRQMLFDGDSREKIKQHGSIGGRGVGWLSTNGGTAQPVKVPFVASMGKLNKVIYDCMARQSAT